MDRLGAMETFVRVVETGSFSAAARQLDLGQPAVSKAIAQLEARLGVRLLMRSTRALQPTEAGKHFYQRARRAIEEAEGAESDARNAHAGLGGRLRVTAGAAFARLYLMPLLPLFLAAHPNLSVDLVLDDGMIDLIGEGIDIGLWFGPLPDSSYTARRVATSGRVVLGTPAYFERAGVPITPRELVRHTAVIYTHDRAGSDTWRFSQNGTTLSVTLPGRLRVTGSEGVRAAVLGSVGLAIAPTWMFAPELASGEVRVVLGGWALPANNMWAVFPTGRLVSAKARAFLAAIAGRLLPVSSVEPAVHAALPCPDTVGGTPGNPPTNSTYAPAALLREAQGG